MKKILFFTLAFFAYFFLIKTNIYAQTITGLGIIGDDFSDEYRANDDRGGEYSTFTKNWVEQLVQYRSINVGEWGCYGDSRRCGYEYNWAHSGATTQSLLDEQQHTNLAQQITSGKVSDVVIAIGNNDYSLNSDFYGQIYNQTLTGVEISAKETQIINNVKNAFQTIHDSGEVNIIVISIYNPGNTKIAENNFPDPVKRALVTASINWVNSEISDFASSMGAIVIDPNLYELNLLESMNSQGEFQFGVITMKSFTNGNDPHFLRLNDQLIPGTIYSGLFANDFFIEAENLGYGKSINPFSENEILNHAGIDPTAPTPTPGDISACDADINQDLVVDIDDYSLLLINYLKNPVQNSRADIDRDGVVDITDYAQILRFYLQSCNQ